MIHQFQDDGRQIFHLSNAKLSCILRFTNGQLEMLHFGRCVSDDDAQAFVYRQNTCWGTSTMYKNVCADSLPLAWSSSGTGDFRESPLEILVDGKSATVELELRDYDIIRGPEQMLGLPQPHGECDTLVVHLRCMWCNVDLYFSLYETALTRRCVVTNTCKKSITITKCMSQMMDLKGSYSMLTLDGAWIRETNANSTDVGFSKVVNESLTGFSSNRHNPGFVLYNDRDVYAFNLIYSGNHYASAQMSIQNFTRVMQGVNPDNFACVLKETESFCTPESVITYSCHGFNGMRENMHKFVNEHIVPQYWQYRERPVLFNDWEGCMFDFTERKLLSLAKQAKKLGCELFVLDDGWFSTRNSDTSGLGDYNVNLKKLPSGITGLSNKIHDMGMKFGLWFEPEAVNPDSDLFRQHPDWALNTANDMMLGRNELLLDLRKQEVRDYIVENVSRILDESKIDYVKWDMNRHSPLLGYDAHEYIIGLYEVLERIFGPRPEILYESCASGGNRFDLGILCYSAQAWASDNTDPIERIAIQEGLSYLYPQSVMGTHISESPHIQTLRRTPLSTRANVSFFGIFGLELDLSHLTNVDMKELKETIEYYKLHRRTFQFGQFSKLCAEKNAVSWQVQSENETLVGIFHTLVNSAQGYEWLTALGLGENTQYRICSRPQLLRVKSFSNMIKYIAPIDPKPDSVVVRAADSFYMMKDAAFETTCSGAAVKSGIPLNLKFIGTGYDESYRNSGDFGSNVYLIEKLHV